VKVVREGDKRRAVFLVRGMDCTTCALAIEKRLKKLEGVERVGASVMLDKVLVDYDASRIGIEGIVEAIKKTGYSSHLTEVREAPSGSHN
jgi:copper chaperone CopZ